MWYINSYKFIEINVLIHNCMTVIHVWIIHVWLSYVYESYLYDSHTGRNLTSTPIVRIDFSRVWQSYEYDMKAHIFTSPSDAHAYHTLRICTRTPIICKRFTLEAYAYDRPTLTICQRAIVVRIGFISKWLACAWEVIKLLHLRSAC